MRAPILAIFAISMFVASTGAAIAHGSSSPTPDLSVPFPSVRTPPVPASTATFEAMLGFESLNTVLPSDAGPEYSSGTASVSGYRLEFTCDKLPVGRVNRCPQTVVDADDIMGNPSFTIDPLVPGRMSFASLHGDEGDGPTEISRGGQTHTTFTRFGLAGIGAADWRDQPYFPPRPPAGNGQLVFGQDVASATDEIGNLYLASLYAHRDESSADDYQYTIATWKYDPFVTILSYTFPADTFQNRAPGSAITRVWIVDVPEVRKVAMLWHEEMPEGQHLEIAGKNLTSWIAGAWSEADPYTPWNLVDDSMIFGPCEVPTNPAVFEDKIYMGCRAGEGYNALEDVEAGDIVVHSLNPADGTSEAVSKSPLSGGNPILAIDEDGDIALATVEVVGEKDIRAELTIGRLGDRWSRAWEFDEQLENATYNVSRAWFTAAIARAESGTIHLVFLEDRVGYDEFGEPIPRFSKRLIALDEVANVLYDRDLALRDYGLVYSSGFQAVDAGEEVFGDLHDTLLFDGEEEWIAFGNYGVIVIAQILEFDERVEPATLAPQTPPPPEPVPATTTLPLVTAAGVTAAVSSAEAVRRMLAAKNAAILGAGGKK